MTVILGIYFDGKKNKTPKQAIDANKNYSWKIIAEEHNSVISTPGSGYYFLLT